MSDNKHISPSGLEFPNPENSIKHKDAGPIFPFPDEVEGKEIKDE